MNLPAYMNDMTDAEKIERLQNELVECAKRCAAGGGLIYAIKAYRAATGAGLKESKEFLESTVRVSPPAHVTDGDRLQRLEDRVTALERAANKMTMPEPPRSLQDMIEEINEHREAVGRRKRPYNYPLEKAEGDLVLINEHAPYGNDPWGSV